MQKVDTYHEGVHTIDPATRGVLPKSFNTFIYIIKAGQPELISHTATPVDMVNPQTWKRIRESKLQGNESLHF
jgi:hypothetical protein